MTQPEHPWPLVEAHEYCECVVEGAEAQRLSDWQHAWAQAAAELRESILDIEQGPANLRLQGYLGIGIVWEQRAQEQP